MEQLKLISPLVLSETIADDYRNVSLATVNDDEIRMSVMTAQFRWHRHPESDETFFGVDGELVIEFEDREVVLGPGEMIRSANRTSAILEGPSRLPRQGIQAERSSMLRRRISGRGH